MSNNIKTTGQSGGVNITGGTVTNSEIVGHDKVTIGGDPTLAQYMAKWRQEMQQQIDSMSGMSPAEKQDAKEQIVKIEDEAKKGAQADKSRLEKLINALAAIAPDIFEVAVTTLSNPLAGVGLALKKIGDRAKIEAKSTSST
ncbi:MAG: hypothetical protein WCF84_09390 [Anaerolineae bacterium]